MPLGQFGISPLTPAYGRDYKSKKELLEDFDANKDFRTPSGSMVSKSDLIHMGHKSISVRYNKLRNSTSIKIEE